MFKTMTEQAKDAIAEGNSTDKIIWYKLLSLQKAFKSIDSKDKSVRQPRARVDAKIDVLCQILAERFSTNYKVWKEISYDAVKEIETEHDKGQEDEPASSEAEKTTSLE